MLRFFNWLWKHGVLNNFAAGVFVLLPIAISIGVIAWAVEKLRGMMGKGSAIGEFLRGLGGTLVHQDLLAALVGWAFVLVAIWLIGVLFRIFAKHEVHVILNGLLNRIPVFNTIYKPVSQVVGLMKQDDKSDMKSMSVIFCSFGEGHGGRFLALLAGADTYRIGGQDCKLVYIPTSPVPMSGGLIFVPAEKIETVEEMSVDDLMKVYFSLGVLTAEVIPSQYKALAASPGTSAAPAAG